jgi:hypothetical protein
VYIGVNGTARKVTKGYIGVGGKARPFWSGGELEYCGAVTPLPEKRDSCAGASAGNYALIAGGRNLSPDNQTNNYLSTVDAYSASLVQTTSASLSKARMNFVGASTEMHAWFAGGTGPASGADKTVDAYNTSLVHSLAAQLSVTRAVKGAARAGGYMLFIEDYGKTATAYNDNLVKTTPAGLGQEIGSPVGASTRSHAVFAGGQYGTEPLDTVGAFNDSLVLTMLAALSEPKYDVSGVGTDHHAVFAGGYNSYTGDSAYKDSVDAYNNSLVHSVPAAMANRRLNHAGAGLDDYALFAGGHNSAEGRLDSVDAYNADLVHSSPASLYKKRTDLTGARAGGYALFAGGYNSVNYPAQQDVVDAYTVT